MASYYDGIEDKSFMDLLGNKDFEDDLKSFFQGGRYNYTDEQVSDVSALANDFVQHMRWQGSNEATAGFDLNYVGKPDDVAPLEGKKAFGRLMEAYDRSAGGGTGPLEGAWDYVSAFTASPSTALTAVTFGLGAGSKLLAKGASAATQIAIRQQVAKMLAEGASEEAVKRSLKKGLLKSFGKEGAKAAAMEGTLGGLMSAANNETREEVIDGYDYGYKDVVLDATIEGALGGTLGGAFGALNQKARNKANDYLVDRVSTGQIARKAQYDAAMETLKREGVSAENMSESLSGAVDVAMLLRAREANTKLDPLDPEKVKEGQQILNNIMGGASDDMIAPGLDMHTVRGIAAAAIDLRETLKMNPGERVSSSVARAIEEGRISTSALASLGDKYGLSNEQLSYLWLAELSKAGQVLGEGSRIASVLSDVNFLAKNKVSSFSDDEALRIVKKVNRADGPLAKVVDGLRETDAARIAFMTSQVGTTAANVVTGGYKTIIDMSDMFWKDVLSATVGQKLPDGTTKRGWTGGTLSILKGYSFDKAESEALLDMLKEEAPVGYQRLFYESIKGGDLVNSNGYLSRASRFVNQLNMATDAVFKQASFYGAVDRALRNRNDPTLGRNVGEFLNNNYNLNSLKEAGILAEAFDYAQGFTFQKDYKMDNSLFGQTAKSVQSLHYKFPYLISAGADIPFPRYLANHLEHINDYTPIGLATGGLDKLDKLIYKENYNEYWGDAFKTGNDRIARQMTGMSLIAGGYYLASEKEGKVEYDKIKTAIGQVDLTRTAGPFAAHLLIGDLLYRWKNDLPITKKTWADMADVLGGIPDLEAGFDLSLITEIYKTGEQVLEGGGMTEGLKERLGDIFATFTYPGTIARDMMGQSNFDAAGTPFTRDIYGGPLGEDGLPEVSLVGERNFLEDIYNKNVMHHRAVRFLADLQNNNIGSMGQSDLFTKGKDLKMFTPFNPNPVGAYNPITKQFGFTMEAAPTQIQEELSLLGLRDYKIFPKSRIPNASVEYVAEAWLSQTMPQEFKSWRKNYALPENSPFAGRTYDELGEDYVLKTEAMQLFIEDRVAEAVAISRTALTARFEDSNRGQESMPRQAAGFVRNLYILKSAEFEQSNKRTYDDVVKIFSKQEYGNRYETARDYLEDSGDIFEELARRKQIMNWAEEYKTIDVFPNQRR